MALIPKCLCWRLPCFTKTRKSLPVLLLLSWEPKQERQKAWFCFLCCNAQHCSTIEILLKLQWSNVPSQQVFEPSALHREALKFAALYVTLNQISVQQGRQLFKVTPKLHLFLEMTFDPKASPSTGWTYRDEDWGGQMSELARRRGGNLTCLAVAQAMFHKFAALHQVPSLWKKMLQLLGLDGVTGEVSFGGGFSFKQTVNNSYEENYVQCSFMYRRHLL